ncbi:MAG: tetratricopeptide repeat protein [Anaeromyxobacter sp.]|nr:tetratricopeptide repeat protein [Anaeromyxobacter sp.]MBL0277253.1 tetratricopeptide repeat protein [Anaeromyxobacter sp.]
MAHPLALLAALAACALAPAAHAAPPRVRAPAAPVVSGSYDSPLGRVEVRGDGTSFTGRLVAPAGPCRFAAGEEVLKGTLLDDSLAGQVRLCLTGPGCQPEAWARTVLLVAPGGLAGAAHVATGCSAPLGRSGGLTFGRVTRAAGPKAAPRARPPPPLPGGPPPVAAAASAPPSQARREQARALLRDGAAWLQEGNFERARRRFLEAIDVDPTLPEAFNGVGVTYRMRDDLPVALAWYKRSLAVDPDFGDAYYNMACVYALQGQTELALRYLQIAAVNGYATAEGIDEDADLSSLRGTPAYRALVKARL